MHLIKVYFTILVSIWLYQSVIAQGASRNLIEDSPSCLLGIKLQQSVRRRSHHRLSLLLKKSELVLKGYYRLGGVWRFCLMDKDVQKPLCSRR